MNLLIKRRQLVMATLVFALGSAVFVNWYFTKPDTAAADSTVKVVETGENLNLGDAALVNSDDVEDDDEEEGSETEPATEGGSLDSSRLTRSKAHAQALDSLNSVIKDSKSPENAVKVAAEKLAELTEAIKLEADIETLVKTKTGYDCVVLINNGTCEIAAEKGALNETTILQIKDIVLKHTGTESKNISVFEIK